MTLQEVHSYARDKLKLEAIRQKNRYDERSKYREFPVGSFCWRVNPIPGKLKKTYLGPFKIVRKYTELNRGIQRHPRGPICHIHTDLLKQYHGETPPLWKEMETKEVSSEETSSISSGEEEEEEQSVMPLPTSPVHDVSPPVRRSRRMVKPPSRLDL